MDQNERVMKDMGRSKATIAVLCVLIFTLCCAPALAQEEPTPTQTEEQPIPQSGEEAPPGYVYFYLDGELAPVERNVTAGRQMAEFGVLELLKGPTEEEKEAGYVTYIPQGVKLQYSSEKTDRSEYSVNLSRELLELSGDQESAAKALAQIEKTLQELTGISIIGITIAGEGMGATPPDAYEALGVTRETAEETDEQDGVTWLIIIIVLAVLAAALLVTLILYVLRRRKAGGAKPAPEKKKPQKRASK
jgi:hypothetical protein